jgi:glycosyltransferase involved in cell wall biosynthesis
MTVRRQPHIGYLVQQFPPEVGAGPARVAEMALHWRDAGARVTVITGMPNRPEGRIHAAYRGKLTVSEDWEGIRVLRSWLYASPRHGFARTVLNNASFMATAAAHALVRAADLDVLIASSPPFFPHVSGAAVAAVRRVPLVLEVRDLWPDYLVGLGVARGRTADALFAVERRLLRRAAHVVVVTDSFRTRVIEKGVAPERVSVIPNGVDTTRYYPAAEPPPLPTLRRAAGEFIVGYLGNFGAGQGLGQVLDAAVHLAGQPGLRFVMAGDGPEREKVHARAGQLGLGNVAIHPPLPKEETRAFYNACDVCLVPLAPVDIFQETIPSKIFEVMACERPVLASLGGEGARVVEQSGGGLVTAPGDGAALAQAILHLRGTPEEARAQMGRDGREYVSAHYAREALAAEYLEILARVATSR